MKVVQLISSGGYYGAENMLTNLLEGLRDVPVDVSLCTIGRSPAGGSELAARATALAIPIVDIPCSGRFDLGTVRRIRNHLKQVSATILHTHGYKADLYGYLAACNLDCSLVSTCHNWTKASQALKLYSLLDKLVLRHYDRVVAVSQQIADELLRAGVPPEHVRLISNGVRVPSEVPNDSSVPSIELTIGIATRLVEEKGVRDLIEATGELLKIAPHIRLDIAGDGPMRHAFEQQVLRLGISERVTFLGFITDMQPFYASVDVFVLPSLREGLPMCILEAMAMGKAVIASRVGAIPTVAKDGESALLIPPGDRPALVTALLRLIQDADLRRRLGHSARTTIESSYSSIRMTHSYLDVYRSIATRMSSHIETKAILEMPEQS